MPPRPNPTGAAVRGFALAGVSALLLGTAPDAGATAFQRFGLSPAGLGLANAMGADAEHVSSMAYNPSALAFQEGTHFQAGVLREYGKLDPPGGKSKPAQKTYLHSLYATYRGPAASWGTGLAINRPFRMDSDFGGDFSSDAAATRSQLDLIDINPAVAYKLRPDVALAVGADFYRALEFTYSTVATKRKGDGEGWGGTAGLMFWREGWAIAASYKTGADLKMDGTNLNGNNFHLPARARIGLKWRPSLRWSVHLDAVRTSWSQYDGLEDDPTLADGKDWDDTVGYRLGSMVRFSDKVALRFGYSFDEGPKDNLTFDPRSASGNRHMLNLGAGWEGDLLRFNLAYSYALTASKKVDGAAVSEYDGRHETTAQFLTLSVGYSDW
jgi:long-chain fatty acid transport protein